MTDSTALPLPPALIERAREFRGTPAPVRQAATVMLLRPAGSENPGSGSGAEEGSGFEVYVLRRATTMVFGGLHAFPGGGVDPSDRPETVRADWAERLGVPDEQARAVVGAAARELFEEAGVLLAGPVEEPDRTVSEVPAVDGVAGNGVAGNGVAGNGVVGDVSAADWEADRAAVQARELTMTELLERRGLRLRDDLLFAWSRWITPEFEPKRFDTWFFVALLPQGQTARDVSGEADGTTWIRPAAADGLAMLPPTRSTLDSFTPYRKIVDVVGGASRRDAATPVMPRVVFDEKGDARLVLGED